MDLWLKDYGLRFFFVETHGLLQAQPRPPYGTFAPVVCPSGLLAFGRDLESAKQVWSSKEGYPGDPLYREFYRDVGYDLEEGYLHPYLQPDGLRRFTGLKYYRVTGPTDQKEPYDPNLASGRALDHARDFLERRKKQVTEVGKWMDRPPLVNCLYDAELFGHWWYEGPEFLGHLFRENHAQGAPLEFVTPSDHLRKHPGSFAAQPAFSSWGFGGYSEFWLNETNDWIYPYLYKACEEMIRMAGDHREARGLEERALNQAARELLLAQASDWAFMMKAGNYRPYAERRVKTHLARFDQLAGQIKRQKVDPLLLADLEEKDNLFPGLDYRIYQTQGK
jgi:1,4-alpha-glucan branching enzyme